MIPREYLLKFVLATTLLSIAQSQNARSYDTSDWIPITNKEQEHVIEKKATGRVLNLADPNPSRSKFFPEEQAIRSKKSSRSNVQQYLREVSPPVNKRLPKRQQPLDVRGLPLEVQQQLNQGEFVNHQYFRQRPYQELPLVREYQKQPQQISQQIQFPNQPLVQHNPQLVPPQLTVLPQGQAYFPGNQFAPRPLFDIPPFPENLNLYPTNPQNLAVTAQRLTSTGINKSYESLNPGIQAINQGLSSDSFANSNNNYKDLKQITLTSTSPKPTAEKETVQLLYVPLESLNQKQAQLQKQEALLQQQELQQLQEAALRQEQQLKAQEEQRKAEQEQQLRIQHEARLKAQHEAQLKAQQEAQIKAQQEEQLKAQQEAQLKAQQEAQQEQALLRQQLLSQEQPLIQHQETVVIRQGQPAQPVQLIDQTQQRRRPVRPQIRQQYQPQIATPQNETPVERKQSQLQSIQNDFAEQALGALKLQLQLQEQTPVLLPQVSSTTTSAPATQPTPKKRKPHQPPLAVYMERHGDVGVTDVLNLLKSAKSISVQDSIGPNSPQVFVGPHNLEPPEGYAKFELPYLSTIENNRVERKVDQLPFFVAPLSYKAPLGYSKIPLPAPHVGSVVVNQGADDSVEKRQQPPYRLENLLSEDPFRLPNQPTYLVEQQPRPIQPFRLENVINEEPYRLPTQPQTILNPFSTPLQSPTTPLVPITNRPDLLGQTINQYELEQINQFLPQPQVQPQSEYQASQVDDAEQNEYEKVATPRQPHTRKSNRVVSTSPATIPSRVQTVTDAPREIPSTTRRIESRSRRPTHRTTASASTQSNLDKQKYTVLEEFVVKQSPTTAVSSAEYEEPTIVSTPATGSQVFTSILQARRQPVTEHVPSTTAQPLALHLVPQSLPHSVNQLLPQQSIPQVEPQLTLQQRRQQIQQQQAQLSNQQELVQQPVQTIPTGAGGVQTFYQLDSNGNFVPIQSINDDYKLVNQQQFEQEVQTFRGSVPGSPTTITPLKEEVPSTTVRITERPTDKNTRSNARGSSRARGRGRTQYVPEVYQESGEEKSEEVENYKLPAELPPIQPEIHSLINDLQDKSIRPLLVPASLAPTTEHATRAQLLRQRQQLTGLSPVEQLEQELATEPPVQQQQHFQQQQQLVSQHVQQLEQQFRSEAPVPQQQFVSQAPLLQRQQYLSQSPLEQLEQELATEAPTPEQQQQQQFVSQHVQQLEQQFRSQTPLQQQQYVPQSSAEQEEPRYVLVSSTEPAPQPLTTASPPPISYRLTTAPPVETTTSRRQRGRQRARVSTTTASSARRTAQRTRKPTSRTRTEVNRYQQELEDYVDYVPPRSTVSRTRESVQQQELEYATESVRRQPSRQRSRTRERQQEVPQLTERAISTNVDEENAFRQPQFQSGFQASVPLLQPQSYMQFEQPFDVVPENEPPVKLQTSAERNQILREYQPIYSTERQPVPLSSTEHLPVLLKEVPIEHQKLSVDVLITHPITESISKAPVFIAQPEEVAPPVRFSSPVEQPSIRVQPKQEVEEPRTRAPQTRQRGRGRGRSRVTTTARPTTTATAASRIKTTTEEEEEEFYGFIRPPNYNRPPPSQNRAKEPAAEPKLFSATYVSSTGKPHRIPSNSITNQYDDQPPETSNTVPIYSKNIITTTPRVQFVGKIRPKFHPSSVKHEESAEVTTEAVTTERRHSARPSKPTYSSKIKARGRPRPTPGRKAQTTELPATTTQKARVPPSQAKGHRFKPRGASAFKLPNNLKPQSDDADVEGGNYPAPFLKAQEDLTERPKFQITIDPGLEEGQSEEDQQPYSSIYRPKVIRTDGEDTAQIQGFLEAGAVPLQNDIPIERKNVESQESLTLTTEGSTNVEEKNDTDVVKSILEEFMGDVEESNESQELPSGSSSSPIDDVDSNEDESESSISKQKNRRRGIWRLVKRPVDTFEMAESQYVANVVANSFASDGNKKEIYDSPSKGQGDESNKGVYVVDSQQYAETTTAENIETTETSSPATDASTQPTGVASSTTEDNFFESLYKMFGVEEDNEATETKDDEGKPLEIKNDSTTEVIPSEYVEVTTKLEDAELIPVNPVDLSLTADQANESDVLLNDTLQISPNNASAENETDNLKQPNEQQNLQSITEPTVLIVDPSVPPQPPSQVSENLDPQIEPWDFGVKTSTSTEISHETEICYRGKCVKASGTKIPTL